MKRLLLGFLWSWECPFWAWYQYPPHMALGFSIWRTLCACIWRLALLCLWFDTGRLLAVNDYLQQITQWETCIFQEVPNGRVYQLFFTIVKHHIYGPFSSESMILKRDMEIHIGKASQKNLWYCWWQIVRILYHSLWWIICLCLCVLENPVGLGMGIQTPGLEQNIAFLHSTLCPCYHQWASILGLT